MARLADLLGASSPMPGRDDEVHAPRLVLGLVVVPVGVGDDLARQRGLRLGVAEHRALDLEAVAVRLDDHARVVRAASITAASRSSSSSTLTMPTLEPSRDGLTHTGSPSSATCSRQSASPARPEVRLAEVDLGHAAVGEQALEGELVDRRRGGEHAGARVGNAEHLERALDGAVLAIGPVHDGEGDVAAEQAAARLELDLVALAEPAPVALDDDVEDLVPGLGETGADRGAGAERDLVLARAAAPEHGDLHGVVVVGSVVVVSRVRRDVVADHELHPRPGGARSAFGATARARSRPRRNRSVSLRRRRDLRPRFSSLRSAYACFWPTKLGHVDRTGAGRVDDRHRVALLDGRARARAAARSPDPWARRRRAAPG